MFIDLEETYNAKKKKKMETKTKKAGIDKN